MDAIHPGYGFLSENPQFAQACADAGIIFIGPDAKILDMMGDKTAARNVARKLQVPDPRRHRRTGERPQGGARRRRRRSASRSSSRRPSAAAAAACASCARPRIWRSCSMKRRPRPQRAFGNGAVFLEKFVGKAKHIEVQILARQARQRAAPARARLLGAAPPPEGHRAGAELRRGSEDHRRPLRRRA